MALWPAGSSVRSAAGLCYVRGSIGGMREAPHANLVLTHAAGFCKELWAPVVSELARALSAGVGQLDWLAIDFSGHGASKDPPNRSTWDRYHPIDVMDVMRAEGLASGSSPIIGVGHSMGGAVLTNLELRNPGTFRRVVAIEPPLFSRAATGACRVLTALGLNYPANAAAKRRRTFANRDIAREHFARRLAANWDARSLDAWVEGGLRPSMQGEARPADEVHSPGDAGGAVELCCEPNVEARTLSWPGESVHSLARGYASDCKFTITTCAESRFSPILVRNSGDPFYRHVIAPAFSVGQASVVQLGEGTTHLVVAERPDMVARLIFDELQRMLAQ
eukprot:scaffold243338_cov31-Tisochrysis_lutea.AAC.1